LLLASLLANPAADVQVLRAQGLIRCASLVGLHSCTRHAWLRLRGTEEVACGHHPLGPRLALSALPSTRLHLYYTRPPSAPRGGRGSRLSERKVKPIPVHRPEASTAIRPKSRAQALVAIGLVPPLITSFQQCWAPRPSRCGVCCGKLCYCQPELLLSQIECS
jgi:hypothetical protein